MISIDSLTKYYGDVCAVDNISLEINKGEVLGLLGPNGAGKSTTLRMLTCYLKPTSGDIRVKGFNIGENPLQIKQIMGYLPESAPLYSDMLVYDYLSFTARLKDVPKGGIEARIRELSGLCGIAEVMHKPVSELSRGYKQRVGLAHAMMSDPEVLVLDEPTSGLDPNQIIEIRNIIKEIGKEKTIVLSTHILSEAEATCDRIVIINKGRIVADGSTAELKKEAGASYVMDLTLLGGADPEDVTAALGAVLGVDEVRPADSQQAGSKEAAFHVYCNGETDARAELYSAIKQKDWVLLDFHKKGRTLENIFRELTKEQDGGGIDRGEEGRSKADRGAADNPPEDGQ